MYPSIQKIAHDLTVQLIIKENLTNTPDEIAIEYLNHYSDIYKELKKAIKEETKIQD